MVSQGNDKVITVHNAVTQKTQYMMSILGGNIAPINWQILRIYNNGHILVNDY